MQIVPLTKDRYADWDKFCTESVDAWFWHTTAWMGYMLNYRPEMHSQSLAFMVVDNDKVLAIVPLMLEEHSYEEKKFLEFSYGAGNCWAPALAKEIPPKKKAYLLNFIFEYVDELAIANGVVRVSFQISPLAPSFGQRCIQFISNSAKFGYLDVSLVTHLLDLSPPVDQLWRDMRKGHRSDIRRGEKFLEVCVFDKDRINLETFEMYRVIHHKAAGRITRPLVTFEMMYLWIIQGCAVLLGCRKGNEFVGFNYLFVYKEGAYYGSAANDPDYAKEPIGHILQWETIQWLKAHGYRFYELGLQHFVTLPYNFPCEKELNIARFKRGFGGMSIPLFIREKYYSAEFYRLVNSERINRYYGAVLRQDTERL